MDRLTDKAIRSALAGDFELIDQMLARQHHQPSCPGCALCMTGTNKPDRTYPDAEDLDTFGRTLRPGT